MRRELGRTVFSSEFSVLSCGLVAVLIIVLSTLLTEGHRGKTKTAPPGIKKDGTVTFGCFSLRRCQPYQVQGVSREVTLSPDLLIGTPPKLYLIFKLTKGF